METITINRKDLKKLVKEDLMDILLKNDFYEDLFLANMIKKNRKNKFVSEESVLKTLRSVK